MLKMDLRELINYFSSKSRIERKEKLLHIRIKNIMIILMQNYN